MATFWSMPLLALSSLAVNTTAEIAQIESKVLANRRAITRAHVAIETHATKWIDGGKELKDVVRVFYLDGQNARCDVQRRYDQMPPYVEQPQSISVKFYTWKRFFSADAFGSYTDQITADGKRIAVNVMPRARAWKQRGVRVPDFRVWGMTAEPLGMSLSSGLETVVAAPNRKGLTLLHTVERQVQCAKITFTVNDAFAQVWIAPSMGYCPIRMQTEYDKLRRNRKTHYVYNNEMNVEQHERSGIWFPVTSCFQRTENGKVTWEERAKATIYSLNEPMDPNLFTLASLGIPAGRRVSRYGADPRQHWIWDGEKVVATEGGVMTAEGQGGGRAVFFFVVISASFAVLASILIWKWSKAW